MWCSRYIYTGTTQDRCDLGSSIESWSVRALCATSVAPEPPSLGFRGLGFRGLGFRLLGFRVEGLGKVSKPIPIAGFLRREARVKQVQNCSEFEL